MDREIMLKEKNDVFRDYQLAEYNLNLCDRANFILLNYLLNPASSDIETFQYTISSMGRIDFINEFTPIEQIFFISYYIYICEFFYLEEPEFDFGIPFISMFGEELQTQKRVYYKDKKYVVDFVIDFARKSIDNTRFIYPKLNKLKYAIELDGFDYHSNKKQMQYDYERENNLKELGYSVIRFTGSQIYKEPYNCIDKLINIITNDINKEIKNERA